MQILSMRRAILIILIFFKVQAHAQNLFPVKLENCKTENFCLDCGDTKAGYDIIAFTGLLDKLNRSLTLAGIQGTVKFQVLVDSKGTACVLSHTDQTNNPISLKIIEEINQFTKWKPAITNGNTEKKSSINLIFSIGNNKISGNIERVDMDAFKKSFDKPNSPQIFNETYEYKNDNLKNYKITVWNSGNSQLPNNMLDYIAIDKKGMTWVIADDQLVNFDGMEFKIIPPGHNVKSKYRGYYSLASDNNNNIWVREGGNIFKYDNGKWTMYDSTEMGINDVYEIYNNPKSGEVYFCSNKGMAVYKDGKWTTINKTKFPVLPSSMITFAKRDSKNKLWIGTFSGTALIDENNQVTNFENSTTVLKGKCITSMDEDENGNLFFTLYEFNRKDKKAINNDEGIAIRYSDGTFKQFTSDNSGMPFNHANLGSPGTELEFAL